jgi:hypothetical protein
VYLRRKCRDKHTRPGATDGSRVEDRVRDGPEPEVREIDSSNELVEGKLKVCEMGRRARRKRGNDHC